MTTIRAYAKINLALVVGPLREDGKHEVVTVLQRIGIHDEIELEPSEAFVVEGFDGDTLVTAALRELAEAAGVAPCWRVRIDKRIPVAAGLGGGSTDAAAALLLANARLDEPLSADELHGLAARLGSDIPFFLREGSQLATRDGTELQPIRLPAAYDVVLLLPDGSEKPSTQAVYVRFDRRNGAAGFAERRAALLGVLARLESPRDLALLPRNDLVTSSLALRLEELGAFRADVSGAGPTLFGLFDDADAAAQAAEALREVGRTWLTRPV
jgi:4-diphosphocytidyl-2-C-methyl-D-erythritol kinase